MHVAPIYTYSFQIGFLVFIMFSFIGWISEVCYVGLFVEHKFVNRGFLHGPICPVYGFGGIAILCLPANVLSSWILLFFLSMIFATAIEYFASWILEKMFHTLLWDYSDKKFNLNGRICLLNAVLFGIMGILVVHFVQPLIMKLISLLSDFVLNIAFDVLVCVFVIDLLSTVRRLVDFHTTMERFKNFVDVLKSNYEHELWFKKSSLSEMLSSIKENIQSRISSEKLTALHLSYIEKFQSRNLTIEKFMKKFPTLKNKQYKDVITYFREKSNYKKDSKQDK